MEAKRNINFSSFDQKSEKLVENSSLCNEWHTTFFAMNETTLTGVMFGLFRTSISDINN